MVTWGHAFYELRSRANDDLRQVSEYIERRSFGFCEGCGRPGALRMLKVASGCELSSYAAVCHGCRCSQGLHEKMIWVERHLEDKSLLYVTAAIVREDDRVLVCQKRSGLWEFPGGKMDEGETLAECLVREIREELSIQIRVLGPLCLVDHDYGAVKLRLFALECELVSGRLVLHDHMDYQWSEIADLEESLFSEADKAIVEELKRRA